MSDDNAALMRKISKLLAKTEERGATEAEAQSAADKVQRMLQEHGLSLAEVEAAGGAADDGGRESREVDGYAASYPWQINLMRAIAEGNMCLYRVSVKPVDGRRAKRHQLVGRRLYVDATRLVYDYLVSTMGRLATDAGYPTTGSAATRRTWLDGCSDRLRERIAERAEAAKRASAQRARAAGSGRDLVVLEDVYGTEQELNNDKLNGFAAGTTATARRETEARRATQRAEKDRLVADGVEEVEAWYRAYGYGAEAAKGLAADWRRRLHARSGGRNRSFNHTRSNRNRARIDSTAYRSGAAAGEAIGLDPQAGSSKRELIGEG